LHQFIFFLSFISFSQTLCFADYIYFTPKRKEERTLSCVLQKPLRVKGTVRAFYDYPLSFRLSPFVKAICTRIKCKSKDFIASGLRVGHGAVILGHDFFLSILNHPIFRIKREIIQTRLIAFTRAVDFHENTRSETGTREFFRKFYRNDLRRT